LVAKPRFWVSDQMRPTGAGAVYPAAAADGIHGREVNFGWSMNRSARSAAVNEHSHNTGRPPVTATRAPEI